MLPLPTVAYVIAEVSWRTQWRCSWAPPAAFATMCAPPSTPNTMEEKIWAPCSLPRAALQFLDQRLDRSRLVLPGIGPDLLHCRLGWRRCCLWLRHMLYLCLVNVTFNKYKALLRAKIG